MSNTCNGTTRQGRPCTQPVATAGNNCGRCIPPESTDGGNRADSLDSIDPKVAQTALAASEAFDNAPAGAVISVDPITGYADRSTLYDAGSIPQYPFEETLTETAPNVFEEIDDSWEVFDTGAGEVSAVMRGAQLDDHPTLSELEQLTELYGDTPFEVSVAPVFVTDNDPDGDFPEGVVIVHREAAVSLAEDRPDPMSYRTQQWGNKIAELERRGEMGSVMVVNEATGMAEYAHDLPNISEPYLETVYELGDGTLEGLDGSWTPVNGHSRQWRYPGPIMHPSETFGYNMVTGVADEYEGKPFFVAVVPVEGYDEEEDEIDLANPSGWMVVHRPVNP